MDMGIYARFLEKGGKFFEEFISSKLRHYRFAKIVDPIPVSMWYDRGTDYLEQSVTYQTQDFEIVEPINNSKVVIYAEVGTKYKLYRKFCNGELCQEVKLRMATNIDNYVWTSWTSGTNGTTCDLDDGTACNSDGIWRIWTTDSGTSTSCNSYAPYDYKTVVESFSAVITEAEVLAAEKAAEVRKRAEQTALEEARKQEEARKRLREEADSRALQLLLCNLEKNQLKIFNEAGKIPIVTKSGKKFDILKGTAGNVKELDKNGKIVHSLCFHPVGDHPVWDVMLAQKLALETMEEEVLTKIANITVVN